MLGFDGDTATTIGLLMPKILVTSSQTDLVAVAVKDIRCTDAGIKLLTSTIRCITFLKLHVTPAEKYNNIILYTKNDLFLL